MTWPTGVCLNILSILLLILGTHAVAQGQRCGQTVTGYMTLTADLTCPTGHGLVVGTNAILDCAGHTIRGGDQPEQNGIYVRNGSNSIVYNCRVEHFDIGILLRQVTNGMVLNSVAQHNVRYGIDVVSSLGALLQGNTVYNNGDEGLHVSGPTDRDAGHRIVGNTINNNTNEGVYLLNSHANTIVDNTIHNHGTAGLYIKGSNRNSIERNSLTNDPIHLTSGSQQNILRGNIIRGENLKFDGASNNEIYNMSIQQQCDRPSNAYEFNRSSGNAIIDSEGVNPLDYHIRASNASTNNVIMRFLAEPMLRCFIDSTSSMMLSDSAGNPLGCGDSRGM